MRQYGYVVTGYAYIGNTYCTECIVDVLKKNGQIFRKHVVKDLNKTLDVLGENKGLDRHDVWETVNTEMPKEIFDVDAEYSFDKCILCDKVL